MLEHLGREKILMHLQISLCGHFLLCAPDGKNVKLTNRKACALLAFLCLSKSGSETRERLSGLLWSDSSESQARASLRQCLKQIKSVFEEINFNGFIADRHEISLSKEHVFVDLLDIITKLQQGNVDHILLHNDGLPERLLYGFDDLSDSFTAWLSVTRQNWRDVFSDELQKQLTISAMPELKKVADALVNIDPTHEPANRQLIRIHADSGNTAAALRQYASLWDVLDTDYAMEPDDATQALITEIKLGTYEKSAVSSEATEKIQPNHTQGPTLSQAPQYPTLQVQQFFTNGDPKLDVFLLDGFRQDLIAGLVRFRDWIILDGKQLGNDPITTSKNNKTDSMGPLFQIDGTLHKKNGELNLVVTLKNSTNNQYVWSESIKLSQDDWFSVIRRFVMRTSSGLSIYLTARDVELQISNPALPKETYLRWLDAYRLIWSWDPNLRARAEKMFREIIDTNPSFAPAYSGLASIFNTEQMIYPGVFVNRDRLEEAAKFARIAVSLDPLDVRSQIALAWSSGMTGRYDLAENHHRLTLDLNPNNPVTLISCANGLAMCGDIDGAKELSDEAVRILPSISPAQWGYLASTRFLCGDYEGCIEAADATQWTVPVTPGWKAAAMGILGPSSSAEEAGQQFFNYIKPLWSGKEPCTPEQVGKWFLQHCPVKTKPTREQMSKGLAKAGLRAETV